ncbi:TetR/AcrR family transcriptional regulator [Halalkalibacter alkalisediminis]|uniref:TetR/AcrR family transcriptional regulator n=1 Tax=Halalkalibacter alkalisediminis TaxID=935616 RepID=A0ABV6NCH3_9BACI|nr:TetR/AcrR family transcriptional regulator [Halalkalibacter alkalisediminis]
MNEKGSTKRKILKTAARLFRQQGYHATGLNQIIQESGTPKGSLYHYFPNGKEELAVESIRITKANASLALMETLAPYHHVEEAFQALFAGFQEFVNNYDEEKEEGAPIGLLALETSSMSEPLRRICKESYEEWQKIFEAKMIECGIDQTRAKELSLVMIVLVEGAVTLSVVNKTSQPFIIIAKQIPSLLNKS